MHPWNEEEISNNEQQRPMSQKQHNSSTGGGSIRYVITATGGAQSVMPVNGGRSAQSTLCWLFSPEGEGRDHASHLCGRKPGGDEEGNLGQQGESERRGEHMFTRNGGETGVKEDAPMQILESV